MDVSAAVPASINLCARLIGRVARRARSYTPKHTYPYTCTRTYERVCMRCVYNCLFMLISGFLILIFSFRPSSDGRARSIRVCNTCMSKYIRTMRVVHCATIYYWCVYTYLVEESQISIDLSATQQCVRLLRLSFSCLPGGGGCKNENKTK